VAHAFVSLSLYVRDERRATALRCSDARAEGRPAGWTLDAGGAAGNRVSQFLIAAKNPRIVLAPRVPVITRLGEFRVRHEMSLLRMREAARERERERERDGTFGGRRDGQVAERSIIGRVAQLQFRERALFPPGFAAGSLFFPFFPSPLFHAFAPR